MFLSENIFTKNLLVVSTLSFFHKLSLVSPFVQRDNWSFLEPTEIKKVLLVILSFEKVWSKFQRRQKKRPNFEYIRSWKKDSITQDPPESIQLK